MDERSMERKNEIAQVIEQYAKQDGTHDTLIPTLRFIRSSRVSEPVYSVYEPSLCVVVQGSKLVMLGQECYRYDPNNYLVASVHLPITGQIVEAVPETPYLSLQLQFDMDQIIEVIHTSVKAERPKPKSGRGLYINHMSDTLHDVLLRLVRLLDTPNDIPVLAPYVIREIVYRVLQDEQGAALKEFALIGSHAQRIAKVIKRMNQDFAMPLRIDELAIEAGMSASSLYYYFKEVTAMSPIQYQKQLRLQEARRLLYSTSIEAADAAFQVGYESPSHFSREYSRMYGHPPVKDIRRFRDELQTGKRPLR